jgi:hypothetical protein
MADRVPKRSRRDERDALFPAQHTWWPLGMSLDEWRRQRCAGAVVATYFTPEREAEINSWWAQAQQRNRERMKTEET